MNTAIYTLTDPDEMKQFYQECIKTIAKIKEIPEYRECIECRVQFGVKPIHQMDAREVTNQFIGYILSAFNDETINRWKKVIPEIVCPTQWYRTFDWLFTHDLGFREDMIF
ncbi:hypothetical protein HZC32_00945 [Candidatus Woesearchaeota archaeon]|nr:hypothetical protein [Candidatus Woesearchaeota archaeon]